MMKRTITSIILASLTPATVWAQGAETPSEVAPPPTALPTPAEEAEPADSAAAPAEQAPAETEAPSAEGEPVAMMDDAEPHSASGAPPPHPNASKIQLTPQADVIDGPRTFHMHEGFYLRANFGYGSLWGSYDVDVPQEEVNTVDGSGSGIALDLLIGGSPSPGFVVGGGLIGNVLFSADFEQDGTDARSRDVGALLVGPFVDGFFNPTDGWHLGGLIGLGAQSIADDGVVDETAGFGGAVWVGYDQWVGDDFSVGGLLRMTLMRSTGTNDTDRDVVANTGAFSLMFTSLYH